MMPRNKTNDSYLPPLLFAVTLFTSAGLLFWIQPLIAKNLLPFWGGTPAVWNTCLLFFQTMLLIGYVYALASSKWLKVRIQAVIHLILILLIAVYIFFNPLHTVLVNPEKTNPLLAVLETLLLSIGLPFFIISASSPLLQSWFSKLQHHRAIDPYFLFAASNAGSLIALVAFPAILEPTLGLSAQFRLWRIGFLVLLILTGAIALTMRFQPPRETVNTAHEPESVNNGPSAKRRLRWLALSFVPSSLMLGVTTYITADVAAVPLLWVIPLALYLLSFVLAFMRRESAPTNSLHRVMFVGALVVTLILCTGATEPAWLLILANLAFFFVAALMCHQQLAHDRPTTTHLPEYYLWIAIGGALGSCFNALIAPLVFTSVLEYPIAIVLACMLQGVGSRARESLDQSGEQQGAIGPRTTLLDLAYALGLFLFTASLSLVVPYLHANSSTIKLLIAPGIPFVLINHFFRERPIRFALGLCAVMIATTYFVAGSGRTLYVARNFFGTIKVTTDAAGKVNSFYSGDTVHGRQFVDPTRRCEPLSYHHEMGPLGQVMAVYNAHPANSHVGVVGLGVGAMVAYSKPDQQWMFYEINPDVIKTARNSQYFTYLQDCARGSTDIVEGDARLNLQTAPAGYYGLLVLDAFSSDAVPVHLITQQALELYLSKLAENGVLVFHASSRSLNLVPILADLAESKNLICIGFDDTKPSSVEGKDPSEWVVMARGEAELSLLSINSQWKRLNGRDGTRVWSDDFSNIFWAIKWH